jgi:hypothetical protein
VFFAKVTYWDWMPEAEGTGLAKVLAVSQFCQFPLLLTSMAANGVAVGGADARLGGAEVGGGGGADEDLAVQARFEARVANEIGAGRLGLAEGTGQRRDRAGGQRCRKQRSETVARVTGTPWFPPNAVSCPTRMD